MPFQPLNDMHWDAIFAEWSLGILSNRELGKKYNLSEASIRGHAAKHGWRRDLKKRVPQRTRQVLDAPDQRATERGAAQNDAHPATQSSLRGESGHMVGHVPGLIVRTGNVIEAIVDEVVAARIDIVRAHRHNVGRYREIIEKYSDNLHDYLYGNNEQRALAAELLFPTDKDTLATSLRVLGDALTRIQALERESYGIQGAPQQASDPNAIDPAAHAREFDFSSLTDDEIRALMKLSQSVIDVTPGAKPPPRNCHRP